MAVSVEPYNKLVKLVARAFYDDISFKADNNQPKNGRGDNRGMAVVVLDALTRRQWIREDDLAKSLKLHAKQLRRTLKHFEEEKLVTRDVRKESAKGAKMFSAAVTSTGNGQQVVKEGEEKLKMHMHFYCCLDYAQIYDVVRYRLHRMKKKLKDELDCRTTVQEYICPNCDKRYSALDALNIMSFSDEYFHCEKCNGELVAEGDKLASNKIRDGDENAKKQRHENLKEMLHKMEEQLQPLVIQLQRIKDLPAPDFGTLQDWEARANAASCANGDSNATDASKSSHGYGGTRMPFLGDEKVEVVLSGLELKEEPDADTKPDTQKVHPSWMIKEGMNLTKEQLGERSPEIKMEPNARPVDDKKTEAVKEESHMQDYIVAFYDEIRRQQQQRENEASTSDLPNGLSKSADDRQVGKKSKRVDEVEDDTGGYILGHLNAEASASGEEDAEDNEEVDWQDG